MLRTLQSTENNGSDGGAADERSEADVMANPPKGFLEALLQGDGFIYLSGWICNADHSSIEAVTLDVSGIATVDIGRLHLRDDLAALGIVGPAAFKIAVFCSDNAGANAMVHASAKGAATIRLECHDSTSRFQPFGAIDRLDGNGVAGWVFDPPALMGFSRPTLIVGGHRLPIDLTRVRQELPFTCIGSEDKLGFQLHWADCPPAIVDRLLAEQEGGAAPVVELESSGLIVDRETFASAGELRHAMVGGPAVDQLRSELGAQFAVQGDREVPPEPPTVVSDHAMPDAGGPLGSDAGAATGMPAPVRHFDGRVEVLTSHRVEGWVWEPSSPDSRIEVELYEGDRFLARSVADTWRSDLASASIGDGLHAFAFEGDFSLSDVRVKVAGEDVFIRINVWDDAPVAVLTPEVNTFTVFDKSFYLGTYPDIAASKIDPFAHYSESGWKEGRQPSYYFSPVWYRQQVDPQELGSDDPLLHYLTTGERAGLRPAPYFDPKWYRNHYALHADESPLAHYMSELSSGQVNPVPEFDIQFYLQRNPDVRNAGIDAFQHFMENGFREGRNPSPTFDVAFYTRRYLSGAENDHPLLHYLARRDDASIVTAPAQGEKTWASETKRFTARGLSFEEFRPPQGNPARRAKALAYYLPQFHPFDENDSWWGTGFTEWTNIARGAPRFEGHYQPRIPRDLGFYDLLTSDVMHRQIEMARAAGIYGFVFYFYWFGRRRLMEKPLERLLADPSLDFPFCLMWANENWTRRWDGFDEDVLIAQDYLESDDDDLVETWLRHFRDRRYIRVGDRPLVMIYRPGIIPQADVKLANWRRLIVAAGENEPIFVMAQGFGDTNPAKYGFDGAIEFPPHKVAAGLDPLNRSLTMLDPDFSGTVFSYDAVVERSVSEPAPAFPLIKAAVPSWDNDARRQGTGMVLQGSSPERYQAWLEQLVAFAEHHPFFGEKFICINAWNEWAEGAYLEPDLHFGSAYLNATARALIETPRQGRNKICLVGHDAHPHGAQMLLQNIALQFVHRFGLEVEIVVLEGGKLVSGYKDIAPTTVASTSEDLRYTFHRLFQRGFRTVIVNSVASARAVSIASAAGHSVTLLVHELPSIIAEKKLEPSLKEALPFVKVALFPAAFVRDRFGDTFNLGHTPTAILPQGSYTSVRFDPTLRAKRRAGLGIQPDDTVVIGMGFADLRKGFDIFLNTWRSAERRGVVVHFVWVGGIEQGIRTYLGGEIEAAKASGRFHTVSFTKDVASYYAAADVLLLTSREDPFPTVVLEALQAGIPSIAFEGSGGIPEMLQRHDAGLVVAMADPDAMVEAILDLRARWPTEGRAGEGNRLSHLGRETFSFPDYAFNLLNAGAESFLKISVVVPNYNYARYMRSRLGSIFGQTCPVFEIIVLDDCSTDASLEVIERIRDETGRAFSIVPNEINSGTVFRQWRKAAELARGDYLWIAEADDESAPDFLARLAAAVTENDNVVLAYSDSWTIDETGKDLAPSYKSYYAESSPGAFEKDRLFEGRTFIYDHLSERNLVMNVSACLWQRRALLEAFDDTGDDLTTFKVAGDWRLYVSALMRTGGQVAYVADPLNAHRRHGGSVTHSSLSAERHVNEIRKVQRVVRNLFPNDAHVTGRQDAYLRKVAQYLGNPDAAEAILQTDRVAAI